MVESKYADYIYFYIMNMCLTSKRKEKNFSKMGGMMYQHRVVILELNSYPANRMQML